MRATFFQLGSHGDQEVKSLLSGEGFVAFGALCSAAGREATPRCCPLCARNLYAKAASAQKKMRPFFVNRLIDAGIKTIGCLHCGFIVKPKALAF